jgi:MFS family permease
MLIPAFLIQACGRAPGEMGWMLAPLGIGMMVTNPFMGALTDRFGVRRVSAGGALLTLVATLPMLYLAIHGLNLLVFIPALLLRGMGMSGVGLPSLTAAYASVSRQKMPMATTSLNIVQRLGGPTMTTLCATFLAWKLESHGAGHAVSSAYAWAFLILCGLHAFTLLGAIQLPRRIDDVAIRQ